MALSKEDIEKIKRFLDESNRPIFFFDDDADGLSSFLLLYRGKKAGKGVVVKSTPSLGPEYAKRVEDYGADVVFVLDKPKISAEFLEQVSIPIVWLDHHEPQENKTSNLHYFNPRINDDSDNTPTSHWAYKVASNPEDLWIAMTGIVGDWHLPSYADEFIKKYPDLLSASNDTPPKALFDSGLGRLCMLFNFLLKGRTSDTKKFIKILTRINGPYEILNSTTPAGKLLYKYYADLKKKYDEIMRTVEKGSDGVLEFFYKDQSLSFTADLSNELLHRNPDKLIIIGREKGDEMKMSLRSAKHDLPKLVSVAVNGLEGYGGGHRGACGAVVKLDDLEVFLSRLKDQL
ncbi:hypothetical protein GOV05_02555 [Candidatus Woesearchaeota archaeon]|nr:hypothetical protein [Candidatus Woesearchaeota archaeon]